ncbi:MAG: EAL domain-containing protein, partial [Acidimicrobiia bacterium]
DSMRTRESHRRALAEELRGALSGTGLLIVHQPIVDLGTGRVTASEALVRWLHPERGLLGPHEFVGIADETGLAVELGTVVLQLACEQLATWKNGLGGESPHLHVNLSPRQLNSPALVATVQAALDRAGADPRQLCLEVSEQDLLADLEPAVAALRNLRSLGVQIAVDDFGTGHSSLAEIRRFPVDILKLDGRLVLGLGPNRGDLAIASAAVRLAHSLDLAVVAEGVETPEQLSILEELGCDRAQGFLFARPGSAAQVDELVRTGPLVPR